MKTHYDKHFILRKNYKKVRIIISNVSAITKPRHLETPSVNSVLTHPDNINSGGCGIARDVCNMKLNFLSLSVRFSSSLPEEHGGSALPVRPARSSLRPLRHTGLELH